MLSVAVAMGFRIEASLTLSGPNPGANRKPSLRASRWFILAVACCFLFINSFYYSSIILLIPFTFREQAGIPQESTQLYAGIMTACYSIMQVTLGPLAGYWSDVGASKQRPLMLAQTSLIVSVVVMWKGTHIAVLILGRLFHGIAASIFWSVGQALLTDAFGNHNAGKAVGAADLSSSAGYLVAPIISGILLERSGANAVYGVSLALAILSFVMTLSMQEGGSTRDVLQQRAAQAHFVHIPDTSASLAGRLRIVRLLLKSRRMLATVFGCFIVGMVLYVTPASSYWTTSLTSRRVSYDAIAPAHMDRVFGWSPWQVGLALAAWYGPKMLSVIPGKLCDRFGARWLTVAGFAASIPALLAASFSNENTDRSKALLVIMTACLAITISFANTPITAAVVTVVADKRELHPELFGTTPDSGLSFGIYLFFWSGGAAIGSLVHARLASGPGWSAANYSLAAWCVAGATIVLIWLDKTGPEHVVLTMPETNESREAILPTEAPKLDMPDLGDHMGDLGSRLFTRSPSRLFTRSPSRLFPRSPSRMRFNRSPQPFLSPRWDQEAEGEVGGQFLRTPPPAHYYV